MSSLAWLDFSEHERRKVLDVVKLFRNSDTVDELGIGSIRDGFSDLLFPGTSTLHTRAAYLIFVPWIYRQVEASAAKSRDPWKSARNLEIRLIDALASSEDGEGTIGINRRAALKTFPSTLYWAALGHFQIRLYRGGQNQYHRWIAQRAGSRTRALLDDEGVAINAPGYSWHTVPDPPQGFPTGSSFQLSAEIGEYLRQRITASARDSAGRETLFAYMVSEGLNGEQFSSPWEMAGASGLPSHLQSCLIEAGNFALVINGAPLLYNLMLAEKAKNADRKEDFEERLAAWAREVRDTPGLRSWNRESFWEVVAGSPARVPPPTERFVNRWLDLSLKGDPESLVRSKSARDLILDREKRIKRGRARLIHESALRLWGGDAGTSRLSYRWDNVRRIVGDVIESQQDV